MDSHPGIIQSPGMSVACYDPNHPFPHNPMLHCPIVCLASTCVHIRRCLLQIASSSRCQTKLPHHHPCRLSSHTRTTSTQLALFNSIFCSHRLSPPYQTPFAAPRAADRVLACGFCSPSIVNAKTQQPMSIHRNRTFPCRRCHVSRPRHRQHTVHTRSCQARKATQSYLEGARNAGYCRTMEIGCSGAAATSARLPIFDCLQPTLIRLPASSPRLIG